MIGLDLSEPKIRFGAGGQQVEGGGRCSQGGAHGRAKCDFNEGLSGAKAARRIAHLAYLRAPSVMQPVQLTFQFYIHGEQPHALIPTAIHQILRKLLPKEDLASKLT